MEKNNCLILVGVVLTALMSSLTCVRGSPAIEIYSFSKSPFVRIHKGVFYLQNIDEQPDGVAPVANPRNQPSKIVIAPKLNTVLNSAAQAQKLQEASLQALDALNSKISEQEKLIESLKTEKVIQGSQDVSAVKSLQVAERTLRELNDEKVAVLDDLDRIERELLRLSPELKKIDDEVAEPVEGPRKRVEPKDILLAESNMALKEADEVEYLEQQIAKLQSRIVELENAVAQRNIRRI